MSEQLDTTRLRDFSTLRSEAGWDYTLRNYIETRGSFELAVAYADLFWPTFIELRGCVIRRDGFSEANFDQWWTKTRGDIALIEKSLNSLHVSELVPSETANVDEDVVRFLGGRIAEMWRSRVTSLFPKRRFVVRFEEEPEPGKTWHPTVFLFQASPSQNP